MKRILPLKSHPPQALWLHQRSGLHWRCGTILVWSAASYQHERAVLGMAR